MGVDLEEGQLIISTCDRLRLAIEVARRGALGDVARSLDWREFEMFTEQCLAEAGYGVKRDVRVRDGTRSWQIDVLGLKAETVLCFDCKHWSSPAYPSKLERAAEHQAAATRIFLQSIWETKGSQIYGLPLVLTLFDPRQRVRNGVVLLSIGQLPDFLGNLAVYSDDLPYIRWEEGNAENPIKEHRF
ncbi:MAG TPA: nuclease-related domain-containing protein [Candidatus Bathyarchaeia archaeon]